MVLEQAHTVVRLSADTVLFSERDPASLFYLVKSGAVRLSKSLADGRRQITGFASPGDWIGVSLNGRYSYAAQTIAKASLCVFDQRAVNDLSRRFPDFHAMLNEQRDRSLAEAHAQLMMLGRMTPIERLCTFLLRSAERAAAAGLAGCTLQMPMTRSDLADYLGVTAETVSRSFSRLKSDDVIALPERGMVQIRDLAALRRIAGEPGVAAGESWPIQRILG